MVSEGVLEEIDLVRTTNPEGPEVACFECGAVFAKQAAFDPDIGCPDCRQGVGRLFQQRDVAEIKETAALITEAEGNSEPAEGRREARKTPEADAL